MATADQLLLICKHRPGSGWLVGCKHRTRCMPFWLAC